MMNTKPTYAWSVEFFFVHAGYSVGPNEIRCEARYQNAVALANAEKWARECGFKYDWEEDEFNSGEWNDELPFYPQWCVTMLDPNGKACEYLGCIDFGRDNDPDYEYQRVVEAELALEAYATHKQLSLTLGVSIK